MTDTKNEPPSVEPERIEAFYDALSTMHMELDADPLELGPKRLNAKISQCRGFLSQTERMFLEVSQDLHWYNRQHRRDQAMFELEVQNLMTNDPEVRAGRNVTDREAIAHTKLSAERKRVSDLKFACDDLEAVLVVIRTKRNDLKDIASRLRDQIKICQEEISLGGRWGSYRRSAGESISEAAGPSDGVMDVLDDALKGVAPDSEEEETTESEDSDLDKLFEEKGEAKELPAATTDSESDKALEGLEEFLPKPIVAEPKNDPALDSILAGFDG